MKKSPYVICVLLLAAILIAGLRRRTARRPGADGRSGCRRADQSA